MHTATYLYLLFKICYINAHASPCAHSEAALVGDDQQTHPFSQDTSLQTRCNGIVDVLPEPPRAHLRARARGRSRGSSPDASRRPPGEVEVIFPPIPRGWPLDLVAFETDTSVGHGDTEVGVDGEEGFDWTYQNLQQTIKISNLRGQFGLIIRGRNVDTDAFSVGARFAINNPLIFRQALYRALRLSGQASLVSSVFVIVPQIAGKESQSEGIATHIRNELTYIFPSATIHEAKFYLFDLITAETTHVHVFDYSTTSDWNVIQEHRAIIRVPRVESPPSLVSCFGCGGVRQPVDS